MNTDRIKDEKIFNVVKIALRGAAYNDISSFNADDILTTYLKHKGLEDAQVLLRMIKNEVEKYNTKLRALIKRIENMPYNQKWRNGFIGKNETIVRKATIAVEKAAAEEDYFSIYRQHY